MKLSSRVSVEPSKRSPLLRRERGLGRLRLGLFSVGALYAMGACSPEFGEQPFACDEAGVCPEGYRCEATVCVAEGVQPTVSRPMRISYINRSEMYWFPSPKGGATLVVNDGFSPGARGLFELHVSPEGAVTGPTKLLDFPGDKAVSSVVLALDDGRYGAVTMSFPKDLDEDIEVALHALPREGSGVTPSVLHRESHPYFGGYEPAYVGGAVVGEELVYAFAEADAGGSIGVVRLRKDGSFVGEQRIDLPPEILPLSADCLMWRAADASLTLRVGLMEQRVYTLDLAAGTAEMIAPVPGTPIFGFGRSIAYLEADEAAEQASYVLRGLDGALIGSSPPFPFDGSIEPYTAVPYGAGALIAPLPSDLELSTIDVGYLGPDGSFAKVGGVPRQGGDAVYTARAFATEGKVYVAWTSFHEQLMDLWIGVSPLKGVP
jgi:hypothetical protein